MGLRWLLRNSFTFIPEAIPQDKSGDVMEQAYLAKFIMSPKLYLPEPKSEAAMLLTGDKLLASHPIVNN